MTTGLLLIDVDGPLNPYDAKPTRRPPGYRTYRYVPSEPHLLTDRELRATRHRAQGRLRLWLNPDHGRMLLDLADTTGLQPVWATTWLDTANTHIAPAIGLPTLPVIPFPLADLAPGAGWHTDGDWKFPGVAAYTTGRPLVWLDDEHTTRTYRAARATFRRVRAGVPTLLCHVDPAIGLQPAHCDRIRAWVDTPDPTWAHTNPTERTPSR